MAHVGVVVPGGGEGKGGGGGEDMSNKQFQ